MKKAILAALLAVVAVNSQANTLICKDTLLTNNGQTSVGPIPLEIHTVKGQATLINGKDQITFDMHRVINDGWKAEDKENSLYRGFYDFGDNGKGEYAELIIVMSKETGITAQYKAKIGKNDLVFMGLHCSNSNN